MHSDDNQVRRDDYLVQVIAACESRIARNEQELEEFKSAVMTQMTAAMEAAIKNAAANPETWLGIRAALHQQSKVVAGGWVLGLFQKLFDKVGLVLFTLAALYLLGGPGAVFAAMKVWIFGTNT